MESYQIKQLERMTGIKAHTIRIWEKRYGLITPHRTSTNRRSYDERQVRKLLNVNTLLALGYKISKLAALTEDELNQVVQNLDINLSTDTAISGYIDDLLRSMLDFNEPAFEKIYAAATTRLGLYEAMIHVFYPFLVKVGVLWNVNKAAPIQEHFASNIIKRKLMAAIDGLVPAAKTTKKFLLFLPPDEWHETGLLLADYIIRSHGYETIYLGQSVPLDGIHKVVISVRPSHLLLFYINSKPKEEIAQQLKSLSEIDLRSTVLVAGNTDLFSENKPVLKNVVHLDGVGSLTNLLKEIKK